MEGRYIRSGHPFRTGSEDEGVSRTLDPEDLSESPPLNGHFGDVMKLPSTSSPKRSRRALQKRVISIPIRDTEGSRLKGEGAPPSDSWAWRKYGQKPIKGSPYPRGYYRCSSSKGCPARKQVERSRDDPGMLIVTYSCEHNHPWPAPRNSHHYNHHHNATSKASMDDVRNKSEADISSPDPEPEHDHEPEPDVEPELAESTNKLTEIKDESPELMLADDEFGWFAGMETTTSSLLQSPFFESKIADEADTDMAMIFPMREEDESLYADLGELPECSVVFRHRDVGTQVQIF